MVWRYFGASPGQTMHAMARCLPRRATRKDETPDGEEVVLSGRREGPAVCLAVVCPASGDALRRLGGCGPG